jgi:hypothetical protein
MKVNESQAQSESRLKNLSSIEELEESISSIRQELLNHPIYKSMTCLTHVQVFMSHHVFAVWDFMSILKSLQNHLTCTELPWMPPAFPKASRLINEIVLGEESDVLEDGTVISHFDLYLKAMKEIDCPCHKIETFVKGLEAGVGINEALRKCEAAPFLQEFVLFNQEIAQKRVHQVAASFLYGREDVIPDMFKRFLESIEVDHSLDSFKLYLSRHIELDEEDHGPKARLLLESVCGDDPYKWFEAKEAAEQAIKARKSFWSGVHRTICDLTM